MSKISQLKKEIDNKYGAEIKSKVKQLVPTIIKSIKDPKKSINPAFILREQLIIKILNVITNEDNMNTTDPVEIAKRLNSRDKYLLAAMLTEIDIYSNRLVIATVRRLFHKSKIATVIGKIIVQVTLYIAYIKAGISLSTLNNITDDRQKFVQYKAIEEANSASAYIDKHKNLSAEELKKKMVNNIWGNMVKNEVTFSLYGASSLALAIAGSVNEEASKAAAEKYNLRKEYAIVFNTIEFSNYVIDGLQDTAIKDLIIGRSLGVALHLTNTLLHKKGLGWAAYVIHFAWNLFAKVHIATFTYKKLLKKILLATS